MTKESDKSPSGDSKFSSKEFDVEAATVFYDFKYKSVMEAATKLTQIAAIFFTAIVVFTGFMLNSKISGENLDNIVVAVSIILILFCIAAGAIIYGVIMGIIQIRETFKKISPSTFDEVSMDAYFRRGIVVLSLVFLLGVVAGIVSLYFISNKL